MGTGGIWNKQVDVVVVGYGMAGAVAAIEAHDAGADTVILEKGQYPGGASILSNGKMLCARDVENAIKYLIKTSGDRVDESLIHTFAQELVKNEEYIQKLAQTSNARIKTTKAHEPGKDTEHGYLTLGYPFDGYKTFYRTVVANIPAFSGFPWVQKLGATGVNMLKIAMDNVEKRSIKVMFSTSARRLTTASGGAVTGIIADNGGKEVAIEARRGVILACGGFEQNEWMLKQFLQGIPFYSMAPLTHTGDGVIMAQKVGAALWHMWHLHGSYGFKFEEFPIAFRIPFVGPRKINRVMPWIAVDKFGYRYLNEYHPAPQDTNHRPMEVFDPDMPGYPRIPSYLIFDEVGRRYGPIAQPLAIGGHIYDWSQDNMKEIARGWIWKEESLEKLTLRIKENKDNEGRMDDGTLKATISQWNDIVKKRKDPLRRPPGTMIPIEAPPFYAVPVWPIVTNTQGGPVHDARQQIIDAFGKPIPRLYAAGELGSIWGHIYLLGGNLGECLTSGRTAGRNAAAELLK